MGQYYKPIFLGADRKTPLQYGIAHRCNNGVKLMEHSYLRNEFVNAVVNEIKKNGGANLVWAGDYADPETDRPTNEELKKQWQGLVANGETEQGFQEYLEGFPETDETNGKNLYSLCEDAGATEFEDYDTKYPNVRYLINEDRKEFVDLWETPTVNGWTIHPLPLLTAEGNGRGGGDYSGLNEKFVGSWARDFITVSDSYVGLEGYTEIKPDFIEEYSLVRGLADIAKYVEVAFADGYDDELVKAVKTYAKQMLSTVKALGK